MIDSDKAELTETVAEASGALSKSDGRRRSAVSLLHTIYRLTKACLLHSDSNQVVLSLVPTAIDTIVEFCDLAGTSAATIVFAGNTVFVNGQMLRASRETYDIARELGAFFEVCFVTELVVEKTVRRAELAAFARLLADAQRDRGIAARLVQSSLRGIRVRRVESPLEGRGGAPPASLISRVSRTYAAAILVMRSFYAALRTGETTLPQRVKRVAQRLIGAAEQDSRLLLSLAAGNIAAPDEAGMSVSTAIVALGIARQLTTDRRLLTGLVTAALLYDAGRLRLTCAGVGREDEGEAVPPLLDRTLNDDEKERLPASAAVMLTALGKLHAPSITRTVVAYEALSLRNSGRHMPLYGGRRSPTLLARILAAARTFIELRIEPHATATGASQLDDVLQHMLASVESGTERTLVKLLIGALGIYPSGTLVQLSTGELAVVLATPALPGHFAQPPVRLLFDAQGALLDKPTDVDLAAKSATAEAQFIVRPVVEVEPHQERAIRAAMSGRSGKTMDARTAADDDSAPVTEPGSGQNEERQRAASSPRAEAAWLGRPLSSSSQALSPTAAGAPRRSLQGDRRGPGAHGDRGRDENLISTQPPPPTAAATAAAVPPPPRLPRDSLKQDDITSRYPAPMWSRGALRRIDTSDDTPTDETAAEQVATISPPAPSIPALEVQAAADLRQHPSARRLDPRSEPEDFTWDDDMPTIDPPPLTSPSPSYLPFVIGAPEAAPILEVDEANVEIDATWADEYPTLDPPPPSGPQLERDRLLAAYLAERTPLPHPIGSDRSPPMLDPQSAAGLDKRAMTPPPSSAASPSSRGAPASSRSYTPSKRPPRPPIPREEPEDDSTNPAPDRRDRT